MEKYDYEILYSKETPNGPAWFIASNNAPLGNNLLAALKHAGQIGWEMVGAAVVALTSRVEIFLIRKIA
jgi:hypothetical protein